jgi:hypothetical protein
VEVALAVIVRAGRPDEPRGCALATEGLAADAGPQPGGPGGIAAGSIHKLAVNAPRPTGLVRVYYDRTSTLGAVVKLYGDRGDGEETHLELQARPGAGARAMAVVKPGATSRVIRRP